VTSRKQYTEEDIQILTDEQHVKKRVSVYLGNNNVVEYDVPIFVNDKINIKSVKFCPAAYKAVNECLDNAIDEFVQHLPTQPTISINAQPLLGLYTIADNGRGVPIKKHKSGKFTPEVVFGSLRSGRNFADDTMSGTIGMNGMGVSLTQMCSTEFNVDIHRDNKRYRQRFTSGVISKPSTRASTSSKTGTTVSFQLDNDVFGDTSLPNELLENRAIEIALTNPGVTTEYNKTKYKFKKGFDDIVKKISNNYFKFNVDGVEFFVIFDIHEGVDEKIFSWVNSSLLFDGGLCNTQFLNAFYDKTITHLEKEAKKNKCVITKNDIRQNLMVLGNLRITAPEYDAQSKTRLTGPNLRKTMNSLVEDNWSIFVRRNKSWLNIVMDRAMIRHHSAANKKAIKAHTKNLSRNVAGLVDATSNDRSICQILITEGLSAASQITDVRDPKTTAALPLTGKVNNVYGTTVAQLLNMGKITNLLTSIGLVPGQKAMRSELRYSKIIIATDADVDGGDIFTLLINLFYQFWPELFDPDYQSIIYRLIAPNVCVVKGDKRIHFSTSAGYEKQKHKYKNWAVNYYKGLGSMVCEDWQMIVSGKTDTLIPITDDGHIKETMKLLFGPSTDDRKRWLQDK
jgi:DNA gyrase subunit B